MSKKPLSERALRRLLARYIRQLKRVIHEPRDQGEVGQRSSQREVPTGQREASIG